MGKDLFIIPVEQVFLFISFTFKIVTRYLPFVIEILLDRPVYEWSKVWKGVA